MRAKKLDLLFSPNFSRSTIDWYSAWPRAALHSVAHRILSPELASVSNGPQECGVGPKIAASLMRASVEVHGGVSAIKRRGYLKHKLG